MKVRASVKPICEKCKVVNTDYLKEIVKTDNDGVIETWQAKEVKKLKSSKQKEEVKEEDLNLED